MADGSAGAVSGDSSAAGGSSGEGVAASTMTTGVGVDSGASAGDDAGATEGPVTEGVGPGAGAEDPVTVSYEAHDPRARSKGSFTPHNLLRTQATRRGISAKRASACVHWTGAPTLRQSPMVSLSLAEQGSEVVLVTRAASARAQLWSLL